MRDAHRKQIIERDEHEAALNRAYERGWSDARNACAEAWAVVDEARLISQWADAPWGEAVLRAELAELGRDARAALAARSEDDGRPPLPPEVVANDKAYMAGLIRGRELEREALAARSEAGAEGPADLVVPPDIAERVNRFETGRNGEDDTLYRAATDRTVLVGVINRLNALRLAARSEARAVPAGVSHDAAGESGGQTVAPAARAGTAP